MAERKVPQTTGNLSCYFLKFCRHKRDFFYSGTQKMCRIIKELYNQFDFLLESDLMNESENQGESFHAEIDEQIVYDSLDADEQAVWSLLLASGYLKVIKL